MSSSLIGAQARHDPEVARARIVSAYAQAGYRAEPAAATLGITYRHWRRLVAELELQSQLDQDRDAAGVRAYPRPPIGPRQSRHTAKPSKARAKPSKAG